MKNKTKFATLAFALACSFVLAQDKATLDLLVAKGLLNRQEADKVAKNEVKVVAKNPDDKSMKLSGLVQAQYNWVNSRASAPREQSGISKNGFQVRRLFIGVQADLGHGFSGVIVADLAQTAENARYLNEAYAAKKVDFEYIKGSIQIGYKKVQFAYEENTSCTNMTQIERSLATRYFTNAQKAGTGNVGFGNRYTGVFWNGKVEQIEGLSYGFAITNATNWSLKPTPSNDYDNTLNYWGNLIYSGTYDLDSSLFKYKAGFNFGYGSGANSRLTTLGSAPSENGSIWGVNPYVELDWRGLRFWADFMMTGIQHGAYNGAQNATPYGYNIALEYKIDIGQWGAIAPTVRYSSLNTKGRGVRIDETLNLSSSVDTTPSPNSLYNCAQSIYVGLNWYIIGNTVKLQAGYEWAEFKDSVAGAPSSDKNADVNSIRMQMQVVF